MTQSRRQTFNRLFLNSSVFLFHFIYKAFLMHFFRTCTFISTVVKIVLKSLQIIYYFLCVRHLQCMTFSIFRKFIVIVYNENACMSVCNKSKKKSLCILCFSKKGIEIFFFFVLRIVFHSIFSHEIEF